MSVTYNYRGSDGPTDVPAKWTCPRCKYESWADEIVNQDLHDGAALRRLREALAPAYAFKLTYGRQFAVSVDYLDGVWTGSTIAEAADKCRAALGR